jgi:hypothetical protein
MVGRIEDYAIVGETRDGAVRVTGAAPERPESPGMSAEACRAKSIQTARL